MNSVGGRRARVVGDPGVVKAGLVDRVLAALGGFEIAVRTGLMLGAASGRRLMMIDGTPALAALMVASRLAPPVGDYCVFCRSHAHPGLDRSLALFRAAAVLELGMDSLDGTGAALSWPLVHSAATLMGSLPDDEEPVPALPQRLPQPATA